MRTINWYFDFISPYAYFAFQKLSELRDGVQIRYRPVLFAGLLNHWGQKGPAEIAGKRTWTYRSCTWYAAQQGIPFRFPSAHPFNPLAYLRLAIAADCDGRAIQRIFTQLWTTGSDPADPAVLEELVTSLGVDRACLSEPQVKEALRANTQQAVAAGVFGVPTIEIDGELFWGADAMEFARAYLENPAILASAEMQRVTNLPVGVARKLD